MSRRAVDRRQFRKLVEIGQPCPLDAHDVAQERPCDGEQLGDLLVGEAVVDVTRPPFRRDEAVTAQDGEMLREMGCLEPRLLLHGSDAHLGCGREDLENADAEGVREPFEESGLHLVEGTLQMS